MADIAGVGNTECIGLGWRGKHKGVAADVDVGNRLLDFRHMAGDALAARTVRQMMRVLGDARCPWPAGRRRAVTAGADLIDRCAEAGTELTAM